MILMLAALLLIGGGLVVVSFLAFNGTGEARGTARSLQMLQQRTISASESVRSDLATKDRLIVPLLDGFRGLGRRLSPSGTADKLAMRLDQAGNPGSWTVERILGAKGVGLIVGALLGLFFGGFTLNGLLYALLGAVAGFFLPDLLVYNAVLKRQESVMKGLANSLDMLTVCVEAGQGFDAALLQVARSTQGPLAGEFARVLSEIQIGSTRAQAFSALGERSRAPEVKTFVSALVQADRMGLPIGGVLREQAANMRLIRRQKAEEAAQKITVKILFPMLVCIFPALFIVIIGPGAIRMIEVFSSM